MKKDTKIIILLAVLLVCVAAYKLTGYYNDKQEKTPTIDFVTINQDDIREITWNYGGIEYTINNETGVWHWTGDEDFPVDEDKANNLAQKFADITATREFSEDDLSEYGVEESEIKITATLSDGESYKFTIGNKNEVTNENYVMLDGNDNIYMVESSFASAFEKTIDDLLKMEDIPQVTDPNKIQIAMGDGTVKEYTKSEDGTWTDGTQTLDEEKVTSLANKFLNLTWERCENYNADDEIKSEKGFDNPYATVTISGSNDEEAVLLFAKDEYEVLYVKLDGSNMIYNVDLSILDSVDIATEDLLPDPVEETSETEEPSETEETQSEDSQSNE